MHRCVAYYKQKTYLAIISPQYFFQLSVITFFICLFSNINPRHHFEDIINCMLEQDVLDCFCVLKETKIFVSCI